MTITFFKKYWMEKKCIMWARYCFRYHAHILSHMLQSKYHSYFADEGVMEAK